MLIFQGVESIGCLVSLACTEANSHVRRMSSVNHTEINNYTEINQLLGGEISWNFFTFVFLYFPVLFSAFDGFRKFLDAF